MVWLIVIIITVLEFVTVSNPEHVGFSGNMSMYEVSFNVPVSVYDYMCKFYSTSHFVISEFKWSCWFFSEKLLCCCHSIWQW